MKRTTTTGLISAAVLAAAVGLPLAAMGTPAGAPQAGPSASGAPGLAADEQASVLDARTLPDGSTVTRYERTYKGLRVVNGRFATKQAPGESLAGAEVLAKVPVDVASTSPALSGEQAAARANVGSLLKSGEKVQSVTKNLVIYRDADDSTRLAYDVYVNADGPRSVGVRTHVYIDANTGSRIATDSDIYTGTGDGFHNKNMTFGTVKEPDGYTFMDSHGNNTRDLQSQDRGNPTVKIYDADDVWGDGAGVQSQGVDAQAALEKTYEYFQNTFDRAGVWNTGKGANAVVRYKKCLDNAAWAVDTMYIGEGADCRHPLGEFDVIAHEMTHGVTRSTSQFVYDKESGGLNEAMSDIFATHAEFYAAIDGDTPDYLIGELVDLRGDGSPLRRLDKPSADGRSYDCWDPAFATGSVNVHYSSGPMNHAFYLMSEGSGAKTINGVAYDSATCNGTFVTGIGRDKAARIIYDALTSPTVSPTSTYAQWRGELVKAAKARYGVDSPECLGVDSAMAAVGTPAASETCGTATAPTSTTTTPTSSTTTASASTPTTSTSATSTTTPPTSTTGTPTASPSGTVLVNGVPVTVSGAAGSEQVYSFRLPATASRLRVSTSGGTGDVDLYLKRGTVPTVSSYDCRPYQTGNSETCSVRRPYSGTYYVKLRGYADYGNVTLRVTWS